MFAGIVTHIGTVARIDKSGGDWKIFIQSTIDPQTIAMGASVSCSGCCLTVIDKDQDWMAFSVSAESLSKTVLGEWQVGTKINLEKSLKFGDELGGHLLSGHVDGVAVIKSIKPEGDSFRLKVEAPKEFSLFLAPKGAVALDGISLTVNEVEGNVFGVNIIPHTWSNTTIGEKKAGAGMNMEIDMLARYIARQLGKS